VLDQGLDAAERLAQREDLGAVLVASALVAAGGGWWRYRQADRAIRAGESLTVGPMVPLLAAAVLLVVLVSAMSVAV